MRQRASLLHQGIVEAALGDRMAAVELDLERVEDRVGGNRTVHIGERPGCRWPPLEVQGSVYRNQSPQQQVRAIDRNHTADMGGVFGETLSNSHELESVIVVDAEIAWAILAGDLADFCRHADSAERGND